MKNQSFQLRIINLFYSFHTGQSKEEKTMLISFMLFSFSRAGTVYIPACIYLYFYNLLAELEPVSMIISFGSVS